MPSHRRFQPRLFVLAAICLILVLGPAIHQFVMLPRRRQTECIFNLKQIGLGLHNYESAWGTLPFAALPNDRLPVEKRLSWQFTLISQLFCAHCWGLDEYFAIDPAGAWDDAANRPLAVVPLSPLICQAAPCAASFVIHSQSEWSRRSQRKQLTPTTYVGITGIGPDAALLPKDDARAGVFGYNRTTRLVDITDGLSTTMIVAETSQCSAPWTAGGDATTRPVDPARRPYIGKNRPFGGNHSDTALVLFVDGSVRPIRDTVAPRVFEAVATIAGAETLPDDWER